MFSLVLIVGFRLVCCLSVGLGCSAASVLWPRFSLRFWVADLVGFGGLAGLIWV